MTTIIVLNVSSVSSCSRAGWVSRNLNKQPFLNTMSMRRSEIHSEKEKLLPHEDSFKPIHEINVKYMSNSLRDTMGPFASRTGAQLRQQ
eukprot:scaffold4233_cov142-Skeletonema_dohrnii-CCMP3373.AAC.9